MKKIALIGSTGSIGVQTLNVVRRNPNLFKVISLSAGSNEQLFLEQIKEFKPRVATIKNEINNKNLPRETEFFFGENAFTKAIVDEADIVVVSLVGFKGIIAVLDAIKKKKDIALANKESLVMGGDLVIKKAKENGVKIVPIDSEHSAVFQALSFDFNKPFRKIILTASGGAFRDYDYNSLINVKAKDALKHPNWLMGNKITIDCATLVNKAFEVIEAKWLYDTSFDKIDAIIHRESIVHSMVEFDDSSIIAQMSIPSMEIPITLALTYPNRYYSGVEYLDLTKIGKLSFEEIDKKKYPCFDLVLQSAKKKGAYTAVANGANERAVELFLHDKISYFDIYRSIDMSLNAYNDKYDGTFESLSYANDFAVNYVNELFGVK